MRLKDLVRANVSTTVLVKGSRSMEMEKVVNALRLDNNNNKQRVN